MNILTAEMNVASPIGQCEVEELKETYTHQEVWKNVEAILNKHYGTDYQLNL